MGFAMEVLRGKPTDVQVLAALGEVFTRTEDMGYYIQLFDGAATEKPDDEALGRLAVYAWARVEDYKKLQAVSKRCLIAACVPRASTSGNTVPTLTCTLVTVLS